MTFVLMEMEQIKVSFAVHFALSKHIKVSTDLENLASKLTKLMGTSSESLFCKAFACPYWKEPEILTFWL